MLCYCSNLLHVGVKHIFRTQQLFLQFLCQLRQGQRQDESRVHHVLKTTYKHVLAKKKTSSVSFLKYISHQNRIHHIIKQTIIRILILMMRHLFKRFMEDIWFPFVPRTGKPISSAWVKWGAKVFVGCTTEAKKKNYRQTKTTPRRKRKLLPPFLFLSFFLFS